MKSVLTILFSLLSIYTIAQVDDTINLDLLRAPALPASNLVGISGNEVQKPTSLKAFGISLQNASQNFSTLPANFGVDIAPFKLGKIEKIQDLLSDTMTPLQVFQNSFVLSFATRTGSNKDTNVDSTQIGFGLKFSLVQGKVSQKTHHDVDDIYRYMEESVAYSDTINHQLSELVKELPEFKEIQNKQVRLSLLTETPEIKEQLDNLSHEMARIRRSLADSLRSKFETLQNSADSSAAKAIRKVENLKIQRYGFSVDFATGLALNFPNNSFSNGKMYKYAAWLTFGWLYESGFSMLGIARYQFNPDKVFADSEQVLKTTNVNTADLGLRLELPAKENSRFSANGEFIYRSVINNTLVKPSWRGTINANYEIRKNYLLTFSFGRDFDKKIYKDGNVIAAINLVAGFGNPQAR